MHSGEKTKRDIIREDIEAAIQHSAIFPEWVRNMRALGYVLDFDRKHTRIFRPEGGRAFRLDSLGIGYSEDEIIRRILQVERPLPIMTEKTANKHVRYRFVSDVKIAAAANVAKPFRRSRPYHKALLFRGFQVQYYRYLYKFGALPTKRIPALRVDPYESKRLDDMVKQLWLLHKRRITTRPQLDAYISSLKSETAALDKERKQLHNKKRSLKSAEEYREFESRLDELSAHIAELNEELKTCGKIQKRDDEFCRARERLREYNERTASRENARQSRDGGALGER